MGSWEQRWPNLYALLHPWEQHPLDWGNDEEPVDEDDGDDEHREARVSAMLQILRITDAYCALINAIGELRARDTLVHLSNAGLNEDTRVAVGWNPFPADEREARHRFGCFRRTLAESAIDGYFRIRQDDREGFGPRVALRRTIIASLVERDVTGLHAWCRDAATEIIPKALELELATS